MAKMPLGMEVDLGPDDLCSMGTQLPPEKGTASPTQFLTHVYCGHGRPSQLLLSSCRQITMTTCWYSYNGHNDTVAEMLHGHCSYSLGGITVIVDREPRRLRDRQSSIDIEMSSVLVVRRERCEFRCAVVYL